MKILKDELLKLHNIRLVLCGGTNSDTTKICIACEAMIETLEWVLDNSDVIPSTILEMMDEKRKRLEK